MHIDSSCFGLLGLHSAFIRLQVCYNIVHATKFKVFSCEQLRPVQWHICLFQFYVAIIRYWQLKVLLMKGLLGLQLLFMAACARVGKQSCQHNDSEECILIWISIAQIS